jgi:tetratricopeptide (TPR) repeat protein
MALASFRLFFFVCIPLILFPSTFFAEEPVEALEKKLNTAAGKQKIEVLNKLAGAYREKSPGKCITFAEEALELSVRFDDLNGKTTALSCLSYGYLYSHNEEAALKHILETKSLYKLSDNAQELADFLYAVGRIYQQKMNKRVQALEFLLEARNLYEKNGDKLKTAISANALGAVYWDINRYDKATYFYFQALKLFKEIGNRETNTATTLNNIGMVYHKMGNYKKALEYYREALQIRQKQGKKGPIGASLNNIGILQFNLQKYQNALEYFRKALLIWEEIDAPGSAVYVLSNMGSIYIILGNYPEALTLLTKAMAVSKKIGFKRGTAIASIHLGEYYIEKKENNRAIFYFEQCIAICREIEDKEMLKDSCRYLSALYVETGNYKKAFAYLKEYSDLNEAIFSKETSQRIANMQTAYELEKKENEFKALRKENEIRRLQSRVQVIAGSATILVLILVLFNIYRYYRFYKSQLIRKEERQRQLELETKLKLFQARINPHFLFNSLNSIKELGCGEKKDPETLEKIVQGLSNIYRQVLYSHETLLVPLKNEINVISDYLEIEKRRFQGGLDYIISVDEGLMECQVLPLTIETLVENSVIHGLSTKKKGTVKIRVYKKGKFISIEIADDGIGFEIDNMEPGFGIYSVQERLKLFYQNKARFRIHSLPGEGTQVVMELPHA